MGHSDMGPPLYTAISKKFTRESKNSNSIKTERQFNTRQIQKKHKMVQQLKMSWQITICLHLKKFRVWFTGHATRSKTSGDVQPLLPHFSFTVPLQHSCCLCLRSLIYHFRQSEPRTIFILIRPSLLFLNHLLVPSARPQFNASLI